MMSGKRSPLVFVVDDDVVTTQLIRGILSKAGFQVACAFDAAGAMSGIREHRPDAVLLDVNLPDGSGLDVCQRLQREPGAAQTPVLFISSNDGVASKVKAFEAGGVDYIPKPISGEEVIARVSTHVRLKQAYESLAELQAERIQRLALAQETLMPQPRDLPKAGFQVLLQQVLKAGGDFYDVVQVGEQVVDYIVADASGHDLAASFWTGALKTLLGEYATSVNPPQDVLRSINSALCRILPSGVFFTMIYGRLNRATGKLQLLNAGHPPALLLPARQSEPIVLKQEGDVLGTFADATFGVSEVKVNPGDRLFLFSDGLIELEGGRDRGLERLAAACGAQREKGLAEMILSVVEAVTQGQTLTDDILFMGVEA